MIKIKDLNNTYVLILVYTSGDCSYNYFVECSRSMLGSIDIFIIMAKESHFL